MTSRRDSRFHWYFVLFIYFAKNKKYGKTYVTVGVHLLLFRTEVWRNNLVRLKGRRRLRWIPIRWEINKKFEYTPRVLFDQETRQNAIPKLKCCLQYLKFVVDTHQWVPHICRMFCRKLIKVFISFISSRHGST